MTVQILHLTAAEVAKTTDKYAKICARAEKRGLTGRIRLVVGDKSIRTKSDPITGIPYECVLYECHTEGEAPGYAGWELLAVLDRDAHAGLIVREVPGAPRVDRGTVAEGRCDHCRTVRRRTVTYVVREVETDRRMQVGRSCAKDFFGHDVTLWTEMVRAVADKDDSDGDGDGNSSDAHTPAVVLAVACAVIGTFGFVPSRSPGSTVGRVTSALYPVTSGDEEMARSLRPLVEESYDRARAVRDYVLSDAFSGGSSYVDNLKAVLAADLISRSSLGLAVSAPQAYARHEETVSSADREPGEHVGREGERLVVDVAVIGVRTLAGGAYGPTTLYTMEDPEGNLIKWFCSGSPKLGASPGGKYRIKASVKSHDTYKGSKETRVSRCTIV